jgi:phosphate/sulfate permease
VTGLSFLEDATGGRLVLLLLFLALALAFEFVNGFHDTANAVATVIYTHALRPGVAVVLSGLCNFLGVHLGGTAVAFSIVYLLPVDLLVAIGSGTGMAMVLALLCAAIVWNLGTWYLGLPASSSHTLIGAILGIGLTNAALQGKPLGAGINWHNAAEVIASLLISPLVGFVLAAGLYLIIRRIARNPRLEEPPSGEEPPPFWIRATLIGTCSAVSVAHGSNDGQKGVGLIMLILIGLLPAQFALNPGFDHRPVEQGIEVAARLEHLLDRLEPSPNDREIRLRKLLEDLRTTLARVPATGKLDARERWQVRSDLLRIDRSLSDLKVSFEPGILSDADEDLIAACQMSLRKATDFAPTWVIVAVACALGCGTMVGWKRIVVTVGEKIGRSHLNYLQGMAAEVVAAGTIGIADFGGMPVSTTHVLSSGVAGTMAVARSGLQYQTLYKIAAAWVLTMPAAMVLSGAFFLEFNQWLA